MKKKLFTGIFASALVLAVGTTGAFAAEPYDHGYSDRSVSGTLLHCVDADHNGLCDTCGAAIYKGAGFIDEDNDGICDNFASGACGNGNGFVDRDGDGICDNSASGACGNSCGFADRDGDGMCDNFTSGTRGSGAGRQRGHHGGRRR